MGDAKEEIDPVPEKVSKDDESPKPEKIEQPPEERPITAAEKCEEILEKMLEKIEPESDESSKEAEKEIEAEKPEENLPAEGETIIEEVTFSDPTSQETLTEKPIRKISDSVPCCPKLREKIIRNQSDIFSLKDVPTTLQTSIFSVNGSPSRRLFRKQEPAGHVFQRSEDRSSDKTGPKISRITRENYNDEKRPSSSYRNPLTGTGLSSNDEYKSKGTKRRDGNPLLGLGYESEDSSAASQNRVPPGGFSHKLW